MTTANATTTEDGYRISSKSTGGSLKVSDLYPEKKQNNIKWKYPKVGQLVMLVYSEERLLQIGAMGMLNSYPDEGMNKCMVYTSKDTPHRAIHCPAIKRVVVIHPRGGYAIRQDTFFVENLKP